MEEGAAEGSITITDDKNAGGSWYARKQMTPLRVYANGKPTAIIAGYTFGNYVYLDYAALRNAFEAGYYHVTTYEERIAEVENKFSWHLIERFDTVYCTAFYGYQGNSHGGSTQLIVVYPDARVAYVFDELPRTSPRENITVQNLALSADRAQITFDYLFEDYIADPVETRTRRYVFDLQTAELAEIVFLPEQ